MECENWYLPHPTCAWSFPASALTRWSSWLFATWLTDALVADEMNNEQILWQSVMNRPQQWPQSCNEHHAINFWCSDEVFIRFRTSVVWRSLTSEKNGPARRRFRHTLPHFKCHTFPSSWWRLCNTRAYNRLAFVWLLSWLLQDRFFVIGFARFFANVLANSPDGDFHVLLGTVRCFCFIWFSFWWGVR